MHKRVHTNFDGQPSGIAVKNEIKALYLANIFASWTGTDNQVNARRLNNYIKSVKDCTRISLVAWNSVTGKLQNFDDRDAIEYLARVYIPWSCKSFQDPNRAEQTYDERRSELISEQWAHSWKGWWNRNKMYVPADLVKF